MVLNVFTYVCNAGPQEVGWVPRQKQLFLNFQIVFTMQLILISDPPGRVLEGIITSFVEELDPKFKYIIWIKAKVDGDKFVSLARQMVLDR